MQETEELIQTFEHQEYATSPETIALQVDESLTQDEIQMSMVATNSAIYSSSGSENQNLSLGKRKKT